MMLLFATISSYADMIQVGTIQAMRFNPITQQFEECTLNIAKNDKIKSANDGLLQILPENGQAKLWITSKSTIKNLVATIDKVLEWYEVSKQHKKELANAVIPIKKKYYIWFDNNRNSNGWYQLNVQLTTKLNENNEIEFVNVAVKTDGLNNTSSWVQPAYGAYGTQTISYRIVDLEQIKKLKDLIESDNIEKLDEDLFH